MVQRHRFEFLATAPVLGYASVVDNMSGDAIFVTPSADTGTPPNQNNPPTEPSTNLAGCHHRAR